MRVLCIYSARYSSGYIFKIFFSFLKKVYRVFNLIEGFNYYFTLKQVVSWEMITNFKLSKCLEERMSRIILHEWTFFSTALFGYSSWASLHFTTKQAKNFKQFSSFDEQMYTWRNKQTNENRTLLVSNNISNNVLSRGSEDSQLQSRCMTELQFHKW